MKYYFFFISLSISQRSDSVVGPAGAVTSAFFILFIALIIMNMTNATTIKSILAVMKLPHSTASSGEASVVTAPAASFISATPSLRIIFLSAKSMPPIKRPKPHPH